MHPRRLSPFRSSRGSTLVTVVFFIAVMALLTASLLQYTGNERRGNERNRLILRARNMAENISAYGAEQITTKLYRVRSSTPIAFIGGANQVHLPPASVLDSESTSAGNGMEIYAGLTGSTGMTFIDPATNPSNANAGLQVDTSVVPVIAKATATHPSLGSVSAYTQHDLEVDMLPLFQFAVFYNMDMEFGPGADMVISGPIHTNGNLIARDQTGFANTVRFTDRVSASGGFYANTAHKGSTYMDTGAVDSGPGGTGPLDFRHNATGTYTSIKTSDGTWRDHKWGGATETTTTLNNFKTFATATYGLNLRTTVHGVTPLQLPDVANYQEADDPATTDDERDNGRQIIEPPSPTDSAGLLQTKIAPRAGLYLVVNPDDNIRTGRKPDGTSVTMLGRSYRAWLNTVNADGSHTLREVVLPGQPAYGYDNNGTPGDPADDTMYPNNLPNRYRVDTSVGANQILRIPQGGAYTFADTGYATGAAPPVYPAMADAYFYDLRRADGNHGYPFNRSAGNPYTPRPIAKIDFDFVRFRMAVERSLLNATASTVYFPGIPTGTATWNASIFNPGANPIAHGLGGGVAFDDFASFAPVHALQRSTLGAYQPGALVITGYMQNGNAAPFLSDYRYVIADTTGANFATATWTDRYTSAGDEVSTTYTPAAGITYLRIRQYLPGSAPVSTNLVDEQIVPVADDATSDLRASLSNDYHLIPSNSNVAGFKFTDAITEMRVFVGGVDDTANWTFSATTVSGGITGALGTGAAASRYTATGISASSGTTIGAVDLTATKGASTVTRRFTLQKQTSVSGAATPANKGFWFTVTSAQAADPFRIYRAPSDPNDAAITTNPASFAVTPSEFVSTTNPSPWFDGITIYLHSVDAEVRAQTAGVPDRVDSGVRFWNGRGPVISLPGATYPGRTGLTFATNDPIYVVGHFNADGTVVADINTTGTGGYSGRYPESASEMLVSLMGDATTILSQPEFSGTAPYRQTSGWSDALSANRRDATFSWSSAWRTTNPSNSNRQDGRDTGVVPNALPHLSVPGVAGTARTSKFAPSETEISAAFLIGIVPTGHVPDGLSDHPPGTGSNNQTSGGVHNYPRLQEVWSGTGLYLRGSLVAMFESRVAMEPWGIRFYTGAGRFWGLHESLRNVNHDLPLEPMLLNARRMRYKEITAAEFTAQKTVIEALPH